MITYDLLKRQLETIEMGSVEEQEMCAEILDDLDGKYPEFDQNYITHLNELKHLFGGCDLSDESWRFFCKDIAEGKYPLEKLPDHVREQAKELYY